MHAWLAQCPGCGDHYHRDDIKDGKCTFCRLAERPKPW